MKNNWIKTTEKLPCAETTVIVSIKSYDILGERTENINSYVTFGWYLPEGHCWIVNNKIRHDIVAWQPLPEPCYE